MSKQQLILNVTTRPQTGRSASRRVRNFGRKQILKKKINLLKMLAGLILKQH